ncbi:hypothetical protein STTU_0944 [Streptomyces sp. Tu6071]|uniref:hypothetical protein n=1 Tax=Streptomyces sp. Tu6071 TaxID=355249 RepID=UPI00020E5276|nr:hypothetical protein [Streptomyces sp. Tu6071]EGJ73733.1 hypothetical protein STTU_0944 [Streptomyces sp. Tu6071]
MGAQISNFQTEMTELSGQGDAQAAEVLGQFNALPNGDKERFVQVLNDPEIFKEMFELSEQIPGPEAPSVATLADGDLVVEVTSETGFSEPGGPRLADATTVTRWASHTHTDKLLGIKISATKVKTNYQTKGKDTTKVLPGTAESYEYIPGCSLGHGVVDEWISAAPADNAQTETIWTADCGGSTWDGRQRVWGDYRGYVGGYLKVFK